jgi:wyosine [tRNA(Phe)-imidazoG37] synthetase (radical SAM superfamily)
MTLLSLQKDIIYGPINSRRLGRSLGINLLPTDCKLCSFDCVYCHYGRTEIKTLLPDEGRLPGVEQVLQAVERALQTHSDVDYVTFSGNGEPTLHPRFPTIAYEVRRLRDELRPGVRMALLSNSTAVHVPQVREALGTFDVPMMKLDAGDRETLARINRPAAAVRLERIVEGLKGIPDLTLQSVLLDGEVSNVRGNALEAWLAALSEIRPARVQIYSTDRPVPESGVERVPPSRLEGIAKEIEKRVGIPVSAYWA